MDPRNFRRRPKRDPINWIRQGEFVEGDDAGSYTISGVTNRPLKELLENDLELLRFLEETLGALETLGRLNLASPWHGDSGSGLSHVDVDYNPNVLRHQSSRFSYQDHTDSVDPGSHQDHTDHLDSPGESRTVHIDIEHEDRTEVLPHADYTDHGDGHTDHGDVVNRPHGDVLHTDHGDHQDRTTSGGHTDFFDHSDWHTDYFNPPPRGHTDTHTDVVLNSTIHTDCSASPPYSDFRPFPSGYSCAVLPQGRVSRPSYHCDAGSGHLDYTDHADYPEDSWTGIHMHFPIIQSWGKSHVDYCQGFEHQDGHKEWFYGDYTIHYDYPVDVQEHLDQYTPGHTDHQDHIDQSYANHTDHGDGHSDHSDHFDQPNFIHANYSDHSDVAHTDVDHGDHNDHGDNHLDVPQNHLDRAQQTVHQDVAENKHTDHSDIPHGDSGSPHQDYHPSISLYHLDIPAQSPPSSFTHGDEGFSLQRDVQEGVYEEHFPGIWHGDRVWHADEDVHGDVGIGDPIHEDHGDVNLHLDTPHGDTTHQDAVELLHGDGLEGQVHLDHGDHADGNPPFSIHGDFTSQVDNRTHQDHSDWAHLDSHLDYAHQDESFHLDRATPASEHLDYSHNDHIDHSDWEHGDHVDAGYGFQVRRFLTYQDHGDSPPIHIDTPHHDGFTHNDYIPEHLDHYDHLDVPHGDREESYFHEDETVSPEHLDISVPHGDLHSDHGDAGAGAHADFHGDHTDHGDYTYPGRHGDFTVSHPHLDVEHGDQVSEEDHYDGPFGPAHQDFYTHSDYPHQDRVVHTDRI